MNTHDVARRARWKARYATKQTARRSRSWVVTTAPARRPGASLWLCSWQRSGSTWLAEMLTQAAGTRLVYEPANLHDSTFTGELAASSPLPEGPGPALDDVVAALRGRVHHPWVDQLNTCHLVRRSVVKDVRGIGIAGEVAVAVPDTPVVVLTRHPISVARSVVALGWTDADDQRTAFLNEVHEWCRLHQRALGDPRLDGAHFVTYEAVVADPVGRVRRLLEWASTFDPTWRHLDAELIDTARPSSTNFRDLPRAPRDQWPGLPAADLDAALRIISEHGLATLYGRTPEASCELDAFAAAARRGEPAPGCD